MIRSMHRAGLISLAVLLIGLDQLVKQAVIEGYDQRVGLLHVHLVPNFGLIFSFAINATIMLVLLSLAVIGVSWLTLRWWSKHILLSTGAVLILLGAVSNLIDRWRVGYVIDWIDVGRYWPVMNGADIVILIGLGLIVWRQSLTTPPAGVRG